MGVTFSTMNQLPTATPQNTEGLGVPWGRAMFNLPRYQMPGTNVNYNGNFGMGGGGEGGAPQPIGGVHFTITRQASSDPVQNIISDIQNPLGGANINFSPTSGGGGGGPLRQQMTQAPPKAPPMGSNIGFGAASPMGIDTSTQALASGGAVDTSTQALAQAGMPQMYRQGSPFSLRTRMLQQQARPGLQSNIFM